MTDYGFKVPDEHIPSEEDLQRLASGDESVVNELVEGLMGYIINEMEWYIKTHPLVERWRDDIISEAFLAMVEYTNKNLGRQFAPEVFIACVKRVCLSAAIRMTSRENLSVTVPEGSLLASWLKDHFQDIRSNTRGVKETDKQTSPDGVFGEVWFDDFIAGLDEREQTMVSMKIGGASDREIGREVDLHHRQVEMKLRKLYERYIGE